MPVPAPGPEWLRGHFSPAAPSGSFTSPLFQAEAPLGQARAPIWLCVSVPTPKGPILLVPAGSLTRHGHHTHCRPLPGGAGLGHLRFLRFGAGWVPAECVHPHHALPSGKDTRVHQSRADVGPALWPHSCPHNQELSRVFAQGSEEPKGGANTCPLLKRDQLSTQGTVRTMCSCPLRVRLRAQSQVLVTQCKRVGGLVAFMAGLPEPQGFSLR